MFGKVLIANRGEIACRIMRTARRLGVKTVAVYSDADAGALHTTMADEAVRIGPPSARESYLDIGRVIAAAQEAGADAIHPGYGFLSENADFAAACEAEGIAFIGPPAAAIRAMGSKSEAKALMESVGVPLVPGYHGLDQSDDQLAKAAAAIGYPVLIKASAGGGGKGMHIVARESELARALAQARREAGSAFGDDRLLIEKYLIDPRHIEVQVFADRHGNVVHLYERDCSIQRRHQKMIEEAPAPGLSDAQREHLGNIAIKATRAVNYVGAGTIEFVAADGNFYFIEMNTRLQVEHVVTEMITGLDLVEWQLRAAAGESLPLTQEAIRRHGHAIEVRLYAEDPARDFLPAAGKIAVLALPRQSTDLRVETGFRQGDTVTPYYDALIAKVIAWGEDRGGALRRLQEALRVTRLAGIACNRDFLARIASHSAYAAGAQDTGFIPRHQFELRASSRAPRAAVIAASLAIALEPTLPRTSMDRRSPWQKRDLWRLGDATVLHYRFRDGEHERAVALRFAEGRYACEIDGHSSFAIVQRNAENNLVIDLDGTRVDATISRSVGEIWVVLPETTSLLVYFDPLAPAHREAKTAGKILAPMPGKISAVLVAPGDPARRGQTLLLMEAMKMELAIAAPEDGVVAIVNVTIGALVEEGTELVVLRAP